MDNWASHCARPGARAGRASAKEKNSPDVLVKVPWLLSASHFKLCTRCASCRPLGCPRDLKSGCLVVLATRNPIVRLLNLSKVTGNKSV